MRTRPAHFSPGWAAVLGACLLIGLPLAGAALSGRPLAPYLAFPPVTRQVPPAPFAWWAFGTYAALFAAALSLLAAGLLRGRRLNGRPRGPRSVRRLPWWGWAGLVWLAGAWTLAWTRLEWMRPWQAHTFAPMWLGYIVAVNALCQQRTGNCLMLGRPRFFLALFPASALFWWFFEYLNRFVENWYYSGPSLGPAAYFWYATLPFATVLPAVLSTAHWLAQARWVRNGFAGLPAVRRPGVPAAAAALTAA